ncbi:MAG: hypothetical protein KAR13_21965, partial [Desulfobulbaceae bacterium]|nr:hypothetical protein [Desulfobulbaceae bacterium]
MNILRNIVALVILLFCIATVAQAAQPEDAGDWIITDGQTLSGSTNISNGSIVIQSGASLDITNAILMMNCTFDGQYNITVENGGTLNITSGSTISAFDDSFYFYIVVKDGANFTMTDSSLSDCGDADPFQQQMETIEVLKAAMNVAPKNVDKKGQGGHDGEEEASAKSEKDKHGKTDVEMSSHPKDSKPDEKKQFGLRSTEALLSTLDLESDDIPKGVVN